LYLYFLIEKKKTKYNDNSKVLVFTKEKLIDVENFIKAIIELIKE